MEKRLDWKHAALGIGATIIIELGSSKNIRESNLQQLFLEIDQDNTLLNFIFIILAMCVVVGAFIALGWLLQTLWNKLGKTIFKSEYEATLAEATFVAICFNILF